MRCQNPFQSRTVGTESVLSSPSIQYILSDPCLSSVFDYGDVHFVGDAQSQLKPKGWLENLITDNYIDIDAHYRERNGRSPTRKCELVMCRASTQVYALVRIIECKKKKKKKKKKKSTMHIIMQLVLSNINF